MTNVKESLMDSKQEMTSNFNELDKAMTLAWRKAVSIQQYYDVNQLTPIQKDYFANNIANVAQELQFLAELIDEKIANSYK